MPSDIHVYLKLLFGTLAIVVLELVSVEIHMMIIDLTNRNRVHIDCVITSNGTVVPFK